MGYGQGGTRMVIGITALLLAGAAPACGASAFAPSSDDLR